MLTAPNIDFLLSIGHGKLSSIARHNKIVLLTKILYEYVDPKLTNFILGDFNLPRIDWAAGTFAVDNMHNIFYNCISDLGFSQFVNEGTRLNISGSNSILDLILSNDQYGLTINNYLPGFSTSDHVMLDFSIFPPQSKINSSLRSECSDLPIVLPIYDWSAANFSEINNCLSNFDWNIVFGYHFDVESIWLNFKSVLMSIITMHVPVKLVSHGVKHKVRTYPKYIRKLLDKKRAIWRTLKLNNTPELHGRYKTVANECRLAIIDFDRRREERTLDANNLGAFYRFVNRKLSSPSGVAPLRDAGGNLVVSDSDKADLLNQFFKSVFTIDDGKLPPFQSRLPEATSGINDIKITTPIIRKILGSLKINSAAGPDQIPSIFYRKAAATLSFPLSILYRSFLDLHDLPSEWKYSIITPVFKKNSPSDPVNYRPIALTCSCCKILESLIANELLTFLNNHNLISKHQHGFLKQHSTCTNLLESLNDWTISLANHKSVAVAYIDFTRAFDSISYSKLFIKLEGYGIGGNLLFWIKAFLSNRTQAVRVGSSMSSICFVTSGIPQGSCLGPLLFNLFINDVTDDLTDVTAKLFADDIKLYTEISAPSSIVNFQAHLDIIGSWARTWQLGISHTKSNILDLGHHPVHATYTILGRHIANCKLIKDLGVFVDSDLTFAHHIHEFVSRAKRRSSLIFRSFLSRNILNFKRAFITYVRPLVEYASPVWSPSHIYLINEIESVQRSFTKRLPGFADLTYSERLSNLKLQTLEHRRLISDLILCYNAVRGFNALNIDSFFKFSNNTTLRGHPYRFIMPLVKINVRRFFLSHRIINIWNSLPSDIVSLPNTVQFKKSLIKLDLSKYLHV